MARDQALVVDASVVLKWFVEETDTEKALQVRDYLKEEAIPIVPAIFFYEIANVLRYKTEFGIEDIKNVVQTLEDFQFRVEFFEKDVAHPTIDLAYQYGITIYDASYIAISKKNQIDFMTADEKLYSKLRGERVILLEDWK
ncbi:MAG: type II toxin-antitoxin system VapC family toxin [Candidatus Heimdallarchaeota archaeon]|nr:MAG: type II toxin-antitoxin system VapC family toxin [Candidatus Heimdallarchaeota archaeon]